MGIDGVRSIEFSSLSPFLPTKQPQSLLLNDPLITPNVCIQNKNNNKNIDNGINEDQQIITTTTIFHQVYKII